MNIGQAAAVSGVPPKTIRYYEGIGLIRPAARTDSGYRVYGETDVAVLRFVKRARSLGFSVEEVAALLALWRDKHRAAAEVQAIARERIRQIDGKIRQLQTLARALRDLSARCEGGDQPDCPVLDELAGDRTGDKRDRGRVDWHDG
jgi:MerR family transcriptional regulator, copper efflux regulator